MDPPRRRRPRGVLVTVEDGEGESYANVWYDSKRRRKPLDVLESAKDWLRPAHCEASNFAALLLRRAPPDSCDSGSNPWAARAQFATHAVVTCSPRDKLVRIDCFDHRTQERWAIGPWTPQPPPETFSSRCVGRWLSCFDWLAKK